MLPNINQNLNPQINQNFKNFNFKGFYDFLNRRNDRNKNFPRTNARRNLFLNEFIPPLNPYLNDLNHSDSEYSKLKNQFIKELDDFSTKIKINSMIL